jgi:NADH-quinone oxidoreductase subunit C
MTADQITARVADRFQGAEAQRHDPAQYKTETGVPYFRVAPEKLAAFASFLRDDPELRFDYLMSMTAVDFLPQKAKKPKPGDPAEIPGRIFLVYHLYSMARNHRAVLKVEDLPRSGARVPSVAAVWPTANWHERECYDFFGVTFDGHPDLRRILLPEDWEGFPMLKDYDPKIIQNRWQRLNLGPDPEDMGPDAPLTDGRPLAEIP